MSEGAIAELTAESRVVICCGSGGVGKTTIAAVLALEGARRGRNTCVVTIDPAKRLADALGLEALSDTPSAIARDRWDEDGTAAPGGSIAALMLDTKSTFDRLVTGNAETDEQAQRILDNRFYRNVSGALGGTQEYMAMEKLHELHEHGNFDLIVVDTPPTRHALDFLDAPRRLVRLLDNRIFRMLMMPTRAYLKVASVAVQTFLRTVSKVVGSEVIDDVVAFFRAFEGMEAGFRTRALAVEELLAAPDTAFVLVTSPRRDALEEAQFFARQLEQGGQQIDALIVNRVHPMFGDEAPAGLRAAAAELQKLAADDAANGPAAARLAARYENLADFREVAEIEREHLRGVHERVGSESITYVPYLARDVYDFAALREIGDLLFDESATPPSTIPDR
ncbi:MAG TPA: ArsA-related P-loop ATPase [Acidimicrobiia bacterium]|nr:ArsA-related P-loop ATPase [Acidimicrobiia bacterium]